VHVFISAPPRYSPSDLVQILKSISAREIFKKFPRMKRQMWSGKIWSDGYFVRSVGDLVTAEIIRKYIEYQNKKRVSTRYVCLKNLRCPAACCGVRHCEESFSRRTTKQSKGRADCFVVRLCRNGLAMTHRLKQIFQRYHSSAGFSPSSARGLESGIGER